MNISVCIPTYNQALFLEQAILSLMKQTLLPNEIIVSNDFSTDNTNDVLEKLSKQINVLKIIQQPVNLGIAKNVDACLRAASGDFIVRLDSDDCLLPNYLEVLSKLLSEYPEAAYAHAAVNEIDQHGNHIKVRKLFRETGFQSDEDALKASVKGYKVAANILMFRKKALIRANYVDFKINFCEDYYLSIKLADLGYGNVYIDEILSCYRVWVDKKQVRLRRKLDEVIGCRIIFDNILEPAFKRRQWSTRKIKRRRSSLASTQATCLSWKIYSINEKKELLEEINKISSSRQVKFTAWLSLNDLYWIIKIFSHCKNQIKKVVKYILLKTV